MDFSQSDEQRLLRKEIIRFARAELNEDVAGRDSDQKFSRDLWEKCGEIGLQGLPVPEEYGGAGVDPVTTAMAIEAFGYGCKDGGLIFAVCAHLLACVVPVWKHASEEQKEEYLRGLCDGRLIAVNGMTEPDSGSDAFAMSTRAVPDGSGYRISGTKTFSSNGPEADLAVLYAMTDSEKGYHGGVTAFLIATDTPGFERGQKYEKMGLRTCPIGELVLDDVYVPATSILGSVGAGGQIFTQSMEWERTCLVASHVGTMERLLEEAVGYAKTRKTYGQSIGKYQAISHKIADMKVRLEAARLLTYRSAWNLERSRTVSLDASITKLFASEALVKTALDTVQVFGGYGYMAEYDVERALRDAVAGTIYSGTSEVQRNIIARWLGL